MKKQIGILICALLLVSATGCGNKDNKIEESNAPVASSEAGIIATGTGITSDLESTDHSDVSKKDSDINLEDDKNPSNASQNSDNITTQEGINAENNTEGNADGSNEANTESQKEYKPKTYEATWSLIKSYDADEKEEYIVEPNGYCIYLSLNNGKFKSYDTVGDMENGTYKNGVVSKKDMNGNKVKLDMKLEDGIMTLKEKNGESYWIFKGCKDSFDYVSDKDPFNGTWKTQKGTEIKLLLASEKGTYIDKAKNKKIKGTYKKTETGILFTLVDGTKLDCRIQEKGKIKLIREDKGVTFLTRIGNIK